MEVSKGEEGERRRREYWTDFATKKMAVSLVRSEALRMGCVCVCM